MSGPFFQWQNDILVKTIYPMREVKLRDFLGFYAELDIWKQYKDKDINALGAEVKAYSDAQSKAAEAAYKDYQTLRAYFLTADVRAALSQKFKALDEPELTEINKMHGMFVSSWPKDIRGERSFVEGMVNYWLNHCNLVRNGIKSLQRRHDGMDPNHPKYLAEAAELDHKIKVIQPMAEGEMDQLRAFLATYDKIEAQKLKWYNLTKSDPNFKTSEADFMKTHQSDQPVTVRDIARWKIEDYKASLANKNQYDLLALIQQKFAAEPSRFPLWLQYMIVHFSGMRYASAHSSWANPKDLLARLDAPNVADQVKKMDDATVVKTCEQKIAQYEGTATPKPKLATATEKEWKDQIGWYLPSIKSNGVSYKRDGLAKLLAAEASYDKFSMSTEDALNALLAKKATFPALAWKMIVELTPLRVTEVKAAGWETLTPAEEAERQKPENTALRTILDAWINADPSAWREEHGRSHELIVSRAVCNETAEHIQHLRGHLPPGGLTPKPSWYLKNETDGTVQGTPRPFYRYPTSADAYVKGASILWLRFVDTEPNAWQVAKPVQTKDGVGLLSAELTGGKKGTHDVRGDDKGYDKKQNKDKDGKKDSDDAPDWDYQVGETTTRTRTVTDAAGVSTVQKQYLRWIHEATFVEIGETPDGQVVLTYETDLPDNYNGVSCIGIFRKPLAWYLTDGPEDQYNRSFVGYLPEGQVPTQHINAMLDWNKILRK